MIHDCRVAALKFSQSAYLDELQLNTGNSLFFDNIIFSFASNSIEIDDSIYEICGMDFKFISGYNRCIVKVFVHAFDPDM